MNLVLGDLLFKCARLYIDDVIVYSDSHEQHVADLAAVLERLSKFGLKAKYGKSYLFRDSVEYLGHVIDQNGIKPMWDNVAALRNLKRPHNIKAVRSLLGTVDYYRRFIPNAALDFIGPLETAPRGYSSILTIVDLFTKFPILIPTKDQCANTVVRALLERIITTFGVPKTILSDRGSAFMSCVFKGVCKAMGVGAVNTTAWRPQSNGAVERLNRTVIESLRRCTAGNNWDTTLPMIALAIRTTVLASTGFTPAKLVFGHELRLPQPFQEEELNPVCEDSITEMAVFYERELVEEVERMREMVRQTYLNEQQEARARFETRELRTFGTGDLVLGKKMHETKGRHKFEPRYRGPYEVLQRAGDTVYLLKDLETGNLDKIHLDRMKAYHAPVKTYPVEDKNLQDQINDVINDEDHWVHPTYPIYSPRPVEPEEPQETTIIRSPLGIVNGVIGDNVGGLEIRRSTRVKKPTGYFNGPKKFL
ncbi:hypothetical protein LAZ67_1003290 [Cordylochernes scorpioides]|uniref:Gag-pol polyprotein n=1 Tax=Cordylochernes scorpioides TaxID=51811 RepID=A0ABY6JYD4_9ARAC|nr:hypothetical protein LAZ67_1003290 [Cordylochernes scorpioides]